MSQSATFQKWVLLTHMVIIRAMSSIISPFFSTEASTRFGIRENLIGVIFGSFPIMRIVISLLLSLCDMARWKSRLQFRLIRIFVLAFAVVTALWGLVPTIFPGVGPTTLTALFTILRGLQGAFGGVIDVLILILLSKMFPRNTSEVLSQREAAGGLGLVVGPVFGGLLFLAGGFAVPLVVSAAVAVLVLIVELVWSWRHRRTVAPVAATPAPEDLPTTSELQLAMSTSILHLGEAMSGSPTLNPLDAPSARPTNPPAPGDGGESEEEEHRVKMTFANLRELFVEVPLYMTVGCPMAITMAFSAFTFLEALVPLYVKVVADVPAWAIGLVFGAGALFFAAAAVAMGYFVNRERAFYRPHGIAISMVVLGTALIFVGPSFGAFDGKTPTTAMVYGWTIPAALLASLSIGPVVIGGVSVLMETAGGVSERAGSAAGAIVGVSTSLGAFIGPVVGAALADAFSYPIADVSFSFAMIGYGIVFFLAYLATRNESTPPPRPREVSIV